MYTKLASAILNDIYSGLAGLNANIALSVEQLEDEIVATRLQIIKEYQLKGILPLRDLMLSINCIPVDCKNLERCPSCSQYDGTPALHFEIPQIINDFGNSAIAYIGSTDRMNSFTIYVSPEFIQKYQKYRKRGRNKPYIYIDPTPNENNMLDGFIFNIPLIKEISVVAIFKDPRQLEAYGCCKDLEVLDNMTFIDTEVKNRLTNQKIQYYRQLHMPNRPNTQEHI